MIKEEISETQQILIDKQDKIVQELEGLTFNEAINVLENVERLLKNLVLRKS